MDTPLHVLIVAGSTVAEALLNELRRGGFDLMSERVGSASDMLEELETGRWDLAVADADLEGLDLPDALRKLGEKGPPLPVIVVTTDSTEAGAARYLAAGAQDVLPRPDLARLLPVVEREAGGLRTRRKLARTEEALRESEERFRQLADNMREVFWLVDWVRHKLIYVSPAYETIWRRPSKDLHENPMDWLEAVHPDDRQRVEDSFFEGAAAGGFDEEYRIVLPDGSIRWIRDRRIPLQNDKGRVVRIAGIAEDQTETKLVQEDRSRLLVREQAARDQAESANRAKDKFLDAMSHELLTPLSPVLSASETLKKSGKLPPELNGLADMIRRNAELELRLITDLLDITRITSGKLELTLGTVDIHAAIAKVLKTYGAEIAAKNLRITTDLGAAERHVNGDQGRLVHVFWNLLGNSIKFTPPGGSIAISTRNPGPGAISIGLSDNGIGIEPEVVNRLFQDLDQGELSLAFGEVGLGLSVSKKLIDLHGGKLSASPSDEGQGTVFTIELATAAASSVQAAPPRAVPAQGKLLTILLVENNEDTLWTLARLLRRLGHQVLTANSAETALQAATANKFDLLISDIGLPDHSGWELMRQLRTHGPVRGIALSGFVSDEDAHKSTESGFSAHLTKPVNINRLELLIQETIRERVR
jgi:PAS domain S-box-containing protein